MLTQIKRVAGESESECWDRGATAFIEESDFGRLDPRIRYCEQGNPIQNFGDYLPELLAKSLLMHPRIEADAYRLIGSVINASWIRRDLRRSVGVERGIVAFWCCGMRDAMPLDARTRELTRFFGVRGPCTRAGLGLPADTVMGDPGLLAPLMHQPFPDVDTVGRTICIPHIGDGRSDAEFLGMSKAEQVVRPAVQATEGALRNVLDRIAAARFVLSASLHGAIVAFAYGRPFAFWDNGNLDVPFKWQDFAESIDVPCQFARDVPAGMTLYADALAPRARLPALTSILDVCPFAVRPAAFVRALLYDGRLPADATPERLFRELDALPSAQSATIRALQHLSATCRANRESVVDAMLVAMGRGVEGLKAVLRRVRGVY